MTDTAVIQPKFHHVTLKTTRLQEMIDWYGTLLGVDVQFRFRRCVADERRGQPSGRAARVHGSRTTPRRTHAPGCTTAPSSTTASRI